MDADTYRVIHYAAAFAVMIGLGVVAGVGGNAERKSTRVIGAVLHGVGLVAALIAGFGMLAKLAKADAAAEELYSAAQPWVLAKLGIWLALGAAIMALRRVPGLTIIWLIVSVLLGGVAGWIAVAKPF